jgi:hypothetical protein
VPIKVFDYSFVTIRLIKVKWKKVFGKIFAQK